MSHWKWLLRFAGHDPNRARLLAEASRDQERRVVQQDVAADEQQFRGRMASIAEQPHISLGTTGTNVSYVISVDDLVSLPSWITGGTGSGKTRFCGAFIDQIVGRIVAGEPLAFVGVDGKGESADLWLRTIASHAERLGSQKQLGFIRRVRVLAYFSETFLPSTPILQQGDGVSIAAQADAVAEVLCEVVSDATVGPRQRSTLAAVLALAIEFDVPLVALPWLLNAPGEVATLAARSSLPQARLDLSRFEREPQGSIDGLIARLGILTRSPSLKAALSGPEPFDALESLEPGTITIYDFSRAPLGARTAVRAQGSLAMLNHSNAVFDPRRRVRGKTIMVIDEPQTFVTSVSLASLERLVTLGRSFGAGGVVFTHQGATQLPFEFTSMLSTNVVLRAIGRSSEADAAAASEWLPITRVVPRPRVAGSRGAESRFLNEGEERRFRIAEVGRLPQRHFVVADRRLGSARVVQAPSYNPPEWDQIDPQVADAVLRGAVGKPRAELEARVRRIEDEAAERFEEAIRTGGSSPRRRGRKPETPDIVGTSVRNRRGEIP